ncbi:MAG: hypothetical protein KKE86_06860 [Planctomycetes bacterium]|nr:hypothetical protein [Planctomycetota bacterium]
MKQHRRFLVILGLAAAAVLAPASTAPASVELRIQITGLSFKYDESQDGSLFDATSIAGGHGTIGEATQVSRIDFFLGGSLHGSLLYGEGLYADFLISGIHNIPVGGGVVNTTSTGPSFGFDLLSSDPALGRFLALELDAVSVTYIRNQIGSFVQFSFIAGGPSAGVVSQDLPFELEIDEGQPITVRVSSVNITNRVEQGGYLTGFWARSGTANVSGVLVPEPACFAALLGIGVIGLEIRAWRKRRRKRCARRCGEDP